MSAAADAMVAKFNEVHASWGIALEPASREPASGTLRQKGGSGLVRYAYRTDARGRYLEFYSFHRIWGDLHLRVYESGEVEHLPILETTTFPTGDPEADRRALAEQEQRNQDLLRQLNEAGLLDGGPVPMSFQVNAAIVTGTIDPDAVDGDA